MCETALRLSCKTIRIPRIGCAQHLAALPDARQAAVLNTHFDRCMDVVCAQYPRLHVSRRVRGDRRNGALDMEGKSDNLFDYRELTDNTLLVNSWGAHAFVGNLGAKGASLNANMIGPVGANTSFLQNPCFVPAILSPINWRYLTLNEPSELELKFDNQTISDCFTKGLEGLQLQFARDMLRQMCNPLRVDGKVAPKTDSCRFLSRQPACLWVAAFMCCVPLPPDLHPQPGSPPIVRPRP